MFFNGSKAEIELDFTPVFIGGPGRSGTSVLHATICSDYESGNVNEYIGECGYLLKILTIFFEEYKDFKGSTKSYFNNNEQEYFLYHSNLVRTILRDTWEHTGRPKNLVLKAPAIFQHFPLLSQLVPQSKFILTVRNPLDIMASMKNVINKYEKGKEFNTEYINEACQNLNFVYDSMEQKSKLLKDKILYLRYEDFIKKQSDKEIEDFLGTKIIEDKIWHSSLLRLETGWLTEKYNNPRQDTSIGNYTKQLAKEEIELVQKLCPKIFSNFNYDTLAEKA